MPTRSGPPDQDHQGRGLLGGAKLQSLPDPRHFPHWDTMGEGATRAACSARRVHLEQPAVFEINGGFPRMQLVETTSAVSDWARWALPDQDHLFDLGVSTTQGQVLRRRPPCLAATPWPVAHTHHNNSTAMLLGILAPKGGSPMGRQLHAFLLS